jgi:hypothetical protein
MMIRILRQNDRRRNLAESKLVTQWMLPSVGLLLLYFLMKAASFTAEKAAPGPRYADGAEAG